MKLNLLDGKDIFCITKSKKAAAPQSDTFILNRHKNLCIPTATDLSIASKLTFTSPINYSAVKISLSVATNVAISTFRIANTHSHLELY